MTGVQTCALPIYWSDYNTGMYFITFCTHDKVCNLGYINPENNVMIYSMIGQYLLSILENSSDHHPYLEIPLFVIMPNHVHAIIVIDDNQCSPNMSNVSRLAIVIRSIKSAVQKYANQNGISFRWQPRFYEHIIQNVHNMNQCALYIENNITNWAVDKLNSRDAARCVRSNNTL